MAERATAGEVEAVERGHEGAACPLLASIVRDHVQALMQLVTLELPEYRMQLVTTKCLNTAVMMLYLALGSAALLETRQCEVPHVRSGFKGSPASVVRTLISEVEEVMRPGGGPKDRTLWYVMITNGDMLPFQGPQPRPQQAQAPAPQAPAPQPPASRAPDAPAPANAHFPGHVFVIEAPGPFLYQSYVRHYDLAGHSPVVKGWDELRRLLEGVVHVVGARVWDAKCSSAWSDLTHIPRQDAARWEGLTPAPDALLPCYRRVRPGGCLGPLAELVERGIAAVKLLREDEMDSPFTKLSPRDAGSGRRPVDQASAFPTAGPKDHPRPPPLTGRQMLAQLTLVRQKLGEGRAGAGAGDGAGVGRLMPAALARAQAGGGGRRRPCR